MSTGVFRPRFRPPPRRRWAPPLAGTTVSGTSAPVVAAFRGAGTYPSGVLTVPGATIRVQPLDGVWETLGIGRLKGITPEAISPSWSYPWGDDQLRFTMKVADGATRPDLLPFTPVELEVAGQVVWAGRVIDVPTDDQDHQVTCQGWHAHLDDDAYEKVYVLTDLSGWRDRRSSLDTTLGEGGFCAAGQVSTGSGGIQVGFADAYVAAAGASAGAFIDLGPDSRAARVTISYETSNDNNSAPVMTLAFRAGNNADGSSTEELNGGPFALTTWGASGTFSATLTTPARYLFVTLYNPGGGTHTMVGDAWARITACTVYAATGYESGGSSALLASTVIADALTRAPLLNQSTDLISTTSFAIPEFATGGYVTPRQVIEGINAYEAYQHRIAGPDRRTLEYRARPSSPVIEIGEWSGVQFSDGSVSGQEIFSKVIVTGGGPDGEPIVERRTTADLSGAIFNTDSLATIPNPGFETNTTGWTDDDGVLSRDTSITDGGSAGSGKMTIVGPDSASISTVITGLRPGRSYRFGARLRRDSGITGAATLAIGNQSTTVLNASLSTSEFTTATLDYIPDGTSVEFFVAVGSSTNGSLYIDNVYVESCAVTLPDRRSFARAKVLPIRSAMTSAVAQRFGDLWLAEKTRAPFAASVTVTGNGVRKVIGGETVPPWTLGNYVGEKLRVSHRVDPDTGAVGRDGRIVGVTYSVDSGQATITLDERRDSFERVLAKYEALVGG